MRFLCDEVGQYCFLLGYFDRRDDGRQARSEYGGKPASLNAPQRDYDNDDYGNNGPRYHYKNHFDPDNDYDDYMN
jgi:hypothetical protein